MINEPITAHERVRALAVAVRDGELTPERRGHVADLPRALATAVGLARRDHDPDNDSAVLGYLIATGAPVAPRPSWPRQSAPVSRGTPRSLSGYPSAEVHRPGATVLGHRRGGLPRRGGVPGGS